MVLAVIGFVLEDSLTRLNALKQAISFSINIAAAIFFLFSGQVLWLTAFIMAMGALQAGLWVGASQAGSNRPPPPDRHNRRPRGLYYLLRPVTVRRGILNAKESRPKCHIRRQELFCQLPLKIIPCSHKQLYTYNKTNERKTSLSYLTISYLAVFPVGGRHLSNQGGEIMKRILIGAAAALLLIAANGAALAQERTEVEVGVKFWFNDWTHDVPGLPSAISDTEALFGPTIGVKFPNRVFVEGSYLVSTSDYSFPDGTRFDRQDLELSIGYMIVPVFGILAGYKNSEFKENFTGVKDTVYGPLIGIIGIAQVDPISSFYGKFDYLFRDLKRPAALKREAGMDIRIRG
jgi:hypothetical protein